jgi:molybdopterin converting factor small subunit
MLEEQYRDVGDTLERSNLNETEFIRVHYWAAAKSAAGVASDNLAVDAPIPLAEVVRRAAALHPGSRLPDVLKACSALVGDRPVSSVDPEAVMVAPGSSVEFLPPFAGG